MRILLDQILKLAIVKVTNQKKFENSIVYIKDLKTGKLPQFYYLIF